MTTWGGDSLEENTFGWERPPRCDMCGLVLDDTEPIHITESGAPVHPDCY